MAPPPKNKRHIISPDPESATFLADAAAATCAEFRRSLPPINPEAPATRDATAATPGLATCRQLISFAARQRAAMVHYTAAGTLIVSLIKHQRHYESSWLFRCGSACACFVRAFSKTVCRRRHLIGSFMRKQQRTCAAHASVTPSGMHAPRQRVASKTPFRRSRKPTIVTFIRDITCHRLSSCFIEQNNAAALSPRYAHGSTYRSCDSPYFIMRVRGGNIFQRDESFD